MRSPLTSDQGNVCPGGRLYTHRCADGRTSGQTSVQPSGRTRLGGGALEDAELDAEEAERLEDAELVAEEAERLEDADWTRRTRSAWRT